MFLHVLADTLGSVSVIISSFLIEQFGWHLADPLCSLLISLLIAVSAWPLLRDTADLLLLKSPQLTQLAQVDHSVAAVHCSDRLRASIAAVSGVGELSLLHVWQHSSAVLCANLQIRLAQQANQQTVCAQVTQLLKRRGVTHICLQLQRRELRELLEATPLPSDLPSTSHSTLYYFYGF